MTAAAAATGPHPRLDRASAGVRPAAPVRIVHLGLGNFFRAHQAWYTDRAPDAQQWGIAAFTGRRPDLARALAPQEGAYTLVTKTGAGDEHEVIASLSAVHAPTEHRQWLGYLRSPQVAIVTLTVTEAGYHRAPDGSLDRSDPEVDEDLRALCRDEGALVRTVPARLVAGLLARRAAQAGALAVVPNDNLPDNGAVVGRVVREAAAAVDPTLVEWIDANVGFVTTMVDRITPNTTDVDREAVCATTGLDDGAPVVTEPFSEWILSGEFPAGRPQWDAVGARFVSDVEPFEQRKLWLLNGSHSLLAYGASLRGHQNVAEAIADPQVRAWVEQWWEEATRHLPLPEGDLTAYRNALLERFANPNIRHLLAQIAADGSKKIPVRILPTLRAERAEGRMPRGALRVLAAWVLHLRGGGAPVSDAAAAQALEVIAEEDLGAAVRRALALVAPELAADTEVVSAVVELAREITA